MLNNGAGAVLSGFPDRQMNDRPLAVIEPRPGEAERRPPSFREADRVDVKGDRFLEVVSANVDVMKGYGHFGLRWPHLF